MPKLTDTQLVILSAAAGRDNGAVLPLPASLRIKGGAVKAVLESLFKKGLVEERPAERGAPFWRQRNGRHLALTITPAGLAIIGVEPEAAGMSSPGATKTRPASRKTRTSVKTAAQDESAASAVRPGTKLATLVDLLNRKEGATLDEIMTATGWQAHSVRGAISGALKKKRGLDVTSEKVEGRGRVYRITETG